LSSGRFSRSMPETSVSRGAVSVAIRREYDGSLSARHARETRPPRQLEALM
jgi:hypothetical protein